MTDSQTHTFLLVVCVLCTAFLVGYDLHLGGDGAALASGLALIGGVGGFGLGYKTNITTN